MKTNVVKNGLHSINGGFQMLSENKVENLSALAEISLILSSQRVADFFGIDETLNKFLSSIHFLLKDLNNESVTLVSKFIDAINENEVDTIDYKAKYEETLIALVATQEKLLAQRK